MDVYWPRAMEHGGILLFSIPCCTHHTPFKGDVFLSVRNVFPHSLAPEYEHRMYIVNSTIKDNYNFEKMNQKLV